MGLQSRGDRRRIKSGIRGRFRVPGFLTDIASARNAGFHHFRHFASENPT